MYLPDKVQKIIDPNVVLVLKPAPDSFLSLFLPIASDKPEVIVEEEVDDEEGIPEYNPDTQPESLDEAAKMLLEKCENLRQREKVLVGKRNMLASQVNELYARGKSIRQREENAKARAQSIFARLQALIEASDNGAKITHEEERLNEAEREMENINIPDIPASSDAVYEFRTGNFNARLTRIKNELDKRLN